MQAHSPKAKRDDSHHTPRGRRCDAVLLLAGPDGGVVGNLGVARRGTGHVRAQDQDGVRGAHEAVEDPGETFTDELGLTVPGAPIDHPGRVYPDSDDFPTGPDAGERLPDFTLPNQHGELIDFHADRNGGKAVVSFQRSAVW